MATKELETIQAEIVNLPEPLSEGKARVLDKRIRLANVRVENELDALLALINEAAEGQIWVALGLPSMSAYLKETVQIAPQDIPERKALAESLAGKGFSNRTTAAILGVDEATIRRDTNGAASAAGGDIEGADGKTYKRKTKDVDVVDEPLDVDEVDTGGGLGDWDYVDDPYEPEPAPKPQPVSKDFRDEMYGLDNTVSSFKDILDDPRFPKAAKTIAKNHLNDLQENIVDLNKIVDCLMEVTPEV
jgi:hypothetical protein